MSRVTEAFRRARDPESAAAAIPPAAPRPRAGSDPNEVPWDFTDAAAPAAVAESPTPPPTESRDNRQARPEAGARSEPLTLLAQRLFQPGGPRPGSVRSVLFSAAGPDGSSASVCAGTADALALQTTASVCVVDANLRSPALDRLFGVGSGRGFSEALLEDRPIGSYLVRLRDNLWALTAGSRCLDAQPALTSPRFQERLTELLASVDYLLIDAAPAGAYPDVAVLGTAVNGVVLVVDASATRREAARHATIALRAAAVTVFGAVMTNRSFPIPEPLYRRL